MTYRLIHVVAQIHLAVLDNEGRQVDTLVAPTTPLYYPHGERLEAAIAQAEAQATALYAGAGGKAGTREETLEGQVSACPSTGQSPPAPRRAPGPRKAPG